MTITIKICGLTNNKIASVVSAMGTRFIGIVLFNQSKRFVTLKKALTVLEQVPQCVNRVGLFVDPDDIWISEVINCIRLDIIQLHGSESVETVKGIRDICSLPIIKALPIHSATDLSIISQYIEIVDWILFDSGVQHKTSCPGGSGITFDWSVVQYISCPIPWILAGGLTSTNVAHAIQYTGAHIVDVSSGVEAYPGVKRIDKLNTFFSTVMVEMSS